MNTRRTTTEKKKVTGHQVLQGLYRSSNALLRPDFTTVHLLLSLKTGTNPTTDRDWFIKVNDRSHENGHISEHHRMTNQRIECKKLFSSNDSRKLVHRSQLGHAQNIVIAIVFYFGCLHGI